LLLFGQASLMSLPTAAAELLLRMGIAEHFSVHDSRIKCMLNGHCLPLDNIQALESFVRCEAYTIGPFNRATQTALSRAVFLRSKLLPYCT
jgi:hypothetical protein